MNYASLKAIYHRLPAVRLLLAVTSSRRWFTEGSVELCSIHVGFAGGSNFLLISEFNLHGSKRTRASKVAYTITQSFGWIRGHGTMSGWQGTWKRLTVCKRQGEMQSMPGCCRLAGGVSFSVSHVRSSTAPLYIRRKEPKMAAHNDQRVSPLLETVSAARKSCPQN